MSTEREKPVLLKKKIKALESQIEQKNSMLTSLKQTEVSNEERLRVLKAQNDTKLKNLNSAISRVRQENSALKSAKPSAKYYFPPISRPTGSKSQRNVSADARLQKSRINEESLIEENARNEGLDMENNNNNENSNENPENQQKNANNNNAPPESTLNVGTLTKQLELLKKENERLRIKNRQVNEKFHTEVASKDKELLELRKLKIELGVLRDKFEILSRKNKPRENEAEGKGNTIVNKGREDTLMFLNKRIQDLQKAIEGKVNENSKIKEEINKYKVKARSLIADKKRILEPKEKMDQECQCEEDETKKEEIVMQKEENGEKDRENEKKEEELRENENLEGNIVEGEKNSENINGDQQNNDIIEKNENANDENIKDQEENINNNINNDEKNKEEILTQNPEIDNNLAGENKKEIENGEETSTEKKKEMPDYAFFYF